MVQVIKRDCTLVDFDKEKIVNAIMKAMKNGSGIVKPKIAQSIADEIEEEVKDKDEISISDIESLVFDKLITKKQRLTARAYEGYRSVREFQRENENTTDKDIEELLDDKNEYWKSENANKNPMLNTTKRDYMAGIISTDATRRYLLPPDIVQAHDEGIIHFHDADYFAQREHNCDLINLEDMLQNGTVISGVLIEKPHSFSTACTVTTQIIAQVASSQYGGQSISLAHLAPFVDVSRKKIRHEVEHETCDILQIPEISDVVIDKIVNERLQEEITKGIQTIQYQLTTLMTTNGQAPFITVYMYLNEAKSTQEKKDLAWLIEEMIKQRIIGVKNEEGVYIAPAFPKLIYVLEDDNITEDSEYWYLTELSAECSAKRLVPDYISEKVMLKLKGDVYTCMGCVDGEETVSYQIGDDYYTETFEGMWDRLCKYYTPKHQEDPVNLYMDVDSVKIFDHKNGYVNVERVVRNVSLDWIKCEFKNGLSIICTTDHPFDTENRGMIEAKDLTKEDVVSTVLGNTGVGNIKTIEGTSYSYDVTTTSEHFTVSGVWSHNCRSFLTPDRFTERGLGNIANAGNYVQGQHKYYGRFNQGVVTLNLPDVALSSEGDMDKFWEILDERCELCHRALRIRHERLLDTPADVAPILWRYGALARLSKGAKINDLLYNGYSTISLGYAGLYECVKYMTGHSHSDGAEGEAFGLAVMQKLNDKCAEWREAENIDYSLYGTPLETTTYKFAKCLKNRFGVIEGITDRDYITNSYHIPVFEPIDAFEKLRIEAKFQELSPGGAISYIETPSMADNVPALLEVIKFMYDNIMYAEINTKSCYCEKCGYDGDIPLVSDEDGKLKWECPQCGNDDAQTMDIAFRVCGYIGTAKNGGNQGRYQDVHDRVYHIDNFEYEGCDS